MNKKELINKLLENRNNKILQDFMLRYICFGTGTSQLNPSWPSRVWDKLSKECNINESDGIQS